MVDWEGRLAGWQSGLLGRQVSMLMIGKAGRLIHADNLGCKLSELLTVSQENDCFLHAGFSLRTGISSIQSAIRRQHFDWASSLLRESH